MLCLRRWGRINIWRIRYIKIIAELDYGSAYIITHTDPDGEERCYDLWLDKEDTIHRLQTIYLLDSKPKEVGQTVGYKQDRNHKDDDCVVSLRLIPSP